MAAPTADSYTASSGVTLVQGGRASADVIAPAWGAATLAGSSVTGTTYTLGASAPASDAFGVTGYRYRLNAGAWTDIGSYSVAVTGRTASATDSCEMQARDAAGNWSTSITCSVTLAAAPLALGNQRIAIWGQSNAIGRAERADIASSPLSGDPGLATYDAGTFDRVYIASGSGYAKLQPAVNNGCDAGQFGAEFGLAVRWMRETTSGLLFIEKWASSGISIANDFFRGGIWPFTEAVSSRTARNSWLTANGFTIDQEKWLWVQGESDAGQAQSWYESRLLQLMADRVTYGFQTATAKSLLVQMPPGTVGYGSGVAAAKTAVAAATPSYIQTQAGPAYMKSDNLHQNGRGQVQMGYDAFELFFSAPHIST